MTDFHHELFNARFPKFKNSIFDESKWYWKMGKCKTVLQTLFTFFIKHGILFENFLLDSKELSFSRDVFLPAFLQIEEETGLKPLIVALEPTEIEEDIFWMCYPLNIKKSLAKINK